MLVVVHHKPLTKLLGDRTLDEISNPQLFCLKQKSLPWKFEKTWLPGKDKSFSDAPPRQPHANNDNDDTNEIVTLINAHVI